MVALGVKHKHKRWLVRATRSKTWFKGSDSAQEITAKCQNDRYAYAVPPPPHSPDEAVVELERARVRNACVELVALVKVVE